MSSSTTMGAGYDHATHDNQVVAMYATDADAQAARQTLRSGGIPEDAIQLVSRDAAAGAGSIPGEGDTGMWGAVRSLFVPDEDRNSYSHAIGHGHAMLVVTPTATTDRAHLVTMLEGTNPIDFDAKLQEWQSTGYDYSQPHEHYAAAAQTMGGAAPVGYASGTGGTGSTVAPAQAVAAPASMSDSMSARDGDTLKVVEEQMRVGKREVAAGAVRIRSYVVERPAEEQIRLRQERVIVDRHPVDRPATAADMDAFKERTIEARATSEEAVVSKEARVVEEIGLRKESTERTETVHDTVRRTEVEVDDGTLRDNTGRDAKPRI